MMRFVALNALLLLLGIAAVGAAHDKQRDICKKGHRGLLFHIKDESDLSKGCKVTVVLKKDCLKLFRCILIDL